MASPFLSDAPDGALDALVTDVHHRTAVAGLRGLGRAGVRVLAVAPHWSAGGLWSRFTAARSVAPDPAAREEAFIAALQDLGRRHDGIVAYPGTEESLSAMVRHAPQLGSTLVLPFPAGSVIDRLRDKRQLLEQAQSAGLDSPRILAEATAAELLQDDALPAPCLVKSSGSKGTLDPPRRLQQVEEVRALLAELPPEEELLLQEVANGPLTAIAVVVDRDGRVVARHQQTAERLWPPDAGGSSVSVSVAPDEPLTAAIARLLAGVGFWGLAHVQFIESSRGPLLIDINPRFYGSLPLALSCGANLPAAWHDVVRGRELPAPGPYRVGIRYRRVEADIFAAVAGHPGELLRRTPSPRTGAMWAPDDPVPGVLLGLESVGTRVWRRLRGRPAG